MGLLPWSCGRYTGDARRGPVSAASGPWAPRWSRLRRRGGRACEPRPLPPDEEGSRREDRDRGDPHVQRNAASSWEGFDAEASRSLPRARRRSAERVGRSGRDPRVGSLLRLVAADVARYGPPAPAAKPETIACPRTASGGNGEPFGRLRCICRRHNGRILCATSSFSRRASSRWPPARRRAPAAGRPVGMRPLPTNIVRTADSRADDLAAQRTPWPGLSPTITISLDDTGRSPILHRETGSKPGVYAASVVFPEAGPWSRRHRVSFGESRLTYGPVLIEPTPGASAGGSGADVPVLPLVAVLGGLVEPRRLPSSASAGSGGCARWPSGGARRGTSNAGIARPRGV